MHESPAILTMGYCHRARDAAKGKMRSSWVLVTGFVGDDSKKFVESVVVGTS
jgi:hypothetical protein